jgi:hypothetical protein
MKKLKLVQIVAIKEGKAEDGGPRNVLYGLDGHGQVWENRWMIGDNPEENGWVTVSMRNLTE